MKARKATLHHKRALASASATETARASLRPSQAVPISVGVTGSTPEDRVSRSTDRHVAQRTTLGFMVLERGALFPQMNTNGAGQAIAPIVQQPDESSGKFAERALATMRELGAAHVGALALTIGCSGRTDDTALAARRRIASGFVNQAANPEGAQIVLSTTERASSGARRAHVSFVMELSHRYRHRGIDVSLRFDTAGVPTGTSPVGTRDLRRERVA